MQSGNFLHWLPQGQRWLSDRIEKLGYKPSELGICYGITFMAIQAILVNDLQTFDERLVDIFFIKPEEFKEKIDKFTNNRLQLVYEVKSAYPAFQDDLLGETKAEKQIRLQTYNTFINSKIREKMAQLPESERRYMDIPAFFEGLMLYQNTLEFKHLWPDGVNVPSQNAAIASQRTFPKKLEDTIGKNLLSIESFCGAYTLDDLTKLFQSLRHAAETENPHRPTILTLSAIGHTITISYDPATHAWVFINPNRLANPRYIYTSEELGKLICEAFPAEKNDKTVFSTTMYGTESLAPSLKNCMKGWKANKDWENIHAVSNVKAGYRGFFGSSWLLCAANLNDTNLAIDLLKHGANPNDTGYNGISPLHIAVLNENIEMAKELLAKQADINYIHKGNHNSLLISAISKHNAKLVEILLAAGANPNIGCNDTTPLIVAASYGDVAIVKLLLGAQKCEPDQKDAGFTALHYATSKNHLDIVRELLKSNKVDANARTPDSTTPLIYAINNHKNSAEIVKELLAHNANPNLANKDNETPLHLAVEQNNNQSAILLLEHKADPNIAASNGTTPLYRAVLNNNVELTTLLLRHNANPDSQLKSGYTPLYIAAERGHTELLRLLLERNANAVLSYTRNVAALRQEARKNNRLNEVDALIKQKDPGGTSKSISITAAESARVMGHENAARLIEAHIKQINIKEITLFSTPVADTLAAVKVEVEVEDSKLTPDKP